MPNRPVLDFWYEFASTYSCLSALRVEELAEAAGVEVRWREPYMRSAGWTRILRPPADPPVASPLVAGGLTHRVRWANEMNVRATPPINGKLGTLVSTVKGGVDGARLTLLPDAAVRVTNSDGSVSWWRKGRFEGGTIGWMRVDFLQPLAGSTVSM